MEGRRKLRIGERVRSPAIVLLDAIATDAVQPLLPSLWFYGVANTVARRYPAQAAAARLETLRKLGIDEVARTRRWLRRALQLCEHHGVTFYDAAYHATALANAGVFVTVDRGYVAKACGAGGVVALGDWVKFAGE